MPLQQVRTPFANMSYTPDVPSTALAANEYNAGYNVETDVRGIRSISGEEAILQSITGTPIFITGGYRGDGNFWFVVATQEGYWYANDSTGWVDITPGGVPFVGYAQNTNVTFSWNGTVLFINDSLNPPMFWPEGAGTSLVLYSNTLSADISNIAYLNPTTQRMTLTTLLTTPFAAGEQIIISGVDNFFNGVFTVVGNGTAGGVTYIDYLAVPGSTYPVGTVGTVSPKYQWNYNPNWKSYYAGWMRMYNTPNVGSILVAGNLTVTLQDDTVVDYPVTVQWSQAFGLNQAPLTWVPTVTNVANQLEVPLHGPCVDAFPSGGQLFLCSYWDTVVFSPLNYSTTSAPILGVRLYNQGRGLLTSNAWAVADDKVYGVDARDIWVFDGQNFKGIGNQRVKNWFFDQLDPLYVDRMFMETNTQKNQVEIYYTDKNSIDGVPNQMLAYRFDLDCWNAPREIHSATFATESPVYSGNVANAGSRTVVYMPGVANSQIIMKDQGASNFDGTAITSLFRRDNIRLLPNYSEHIYVHRILPEVVNIDGRGIPIYPSNGNISVTIEGALSVGSSPTYTVPINMQINTDYPWTQIEQNESRVSTIAIGSTSNVNLWICSAASWQVSKVEDDR